jgi:hypothetical protein
MRRFGGHFSAANANKLNAPRGGQDAAKLLATTYFPQVVGKQMATFVFD